MNVIKIFLVVTAGALAGMLLGGLFGASAGMLAPGLFQTLFAAHKLEPVGTATVLSATVGVLLGGGLVAFGLVLEVLGKKDRP